MANSPNFPAFYPFSAVDSSTTPSYDAVLPPPEPPSFSFTAGGSPFFPSYPSVPPPPPPATFVTFPANISALVLPRSPKSQPGSRKLLVPAISAVLTVATFTGLAFFLYGHWRGHNRHFKEEDKSLASDNSSRELCPPQRNTANKLSVSPTASEVLYLSNVVTPRSADDQGYNGIVESGPDLSKTESPEIRPLPPLPPRGFEQNYEAAGSLTEEEDGDEEEEFYSPLASLAGSESSTSPRHGFGSGHGLERQEPGPRNIPYSTCSCSSSCFGSPARSLSITISPPMSSTVPWRDSDASSERNLRSPSLSIASPTLTM
ncbi:PREDICTED: formin-like protein 10, partial [Tarenaya hassleriana]|uniref:formin-like protein 10 n=1 Tax=Tarenaya hassleriana TaxID=28532 RepID=UPI00053C6360